MHIGDSKDEPMAHVLITSWVFPFLQSFTEYHEARLAFDASIYCSTFLAVEF